jgi:hypothetical protein
MATEIYDFSMRLRESRRERRVNDLKHDNALLARVVSETRIEIARLRRLLATF